MTVNIRSCYPVQYLQDQFKDAIADEKRSSVYGPNFLAYDDPTICQLADRLEKLGLKNVRPTC